MSQKTLGVFLLICLHTVPKGRVKDKNKDDIEFLLKEKLIEEKDSVYSSTKRGKDFLDKFLERLKTQK